MPDFFEEIKDVHWPLAFLTFIEKFAICSGLCNIW